MKSRKKNFIRFDSCFYAYFLCILIPFYYSYSLISQFPAHFHQLIKVNKLTQSYMDALSPIWTLHLWSAHNRQGTCLLPYCHWIILCWNWMPLFVTGEWNVNLMLSAFIREQAHCTGCQGKLTVLYNNERGGEKSISHQEWLFPPLWCCSSVCGSMETSQLEMRGKYRNVSSFTYEWIW